MIIANDGKPLANIFQFYSWLTVSYVQLGDETEMGCRSIGRPLMKLEGPS